jgi:hypothetical protein
MDWTLDLLTQLGSTNNYSATANFQTLQITAANTKSSPACSVFNSRSLATASISGESWLTALKSILSSEHPATESSQFNYSAIPPLRRSAALPTLN